MTICYCTARYAVKAGRVPQLPPLDEVLSAEDARAALEQQVRLAWLACNQS